MISQKDQKSRQKRQEELDEVIMDKEEEISRLRDHNQKLLLQIKKAKEEVQCNQKLEEEIRDLQKELSGKDKENSSLKRVNQELLEKTKKLREGEKPQEERLKKIQYDNKLLENKLVQTLKEASRLSVKQIQIGEQEVKLERKQTIKTTYRHPNYKKHFDQ